MVMARLRFSDRAVHSFFASLSSCESTSASAPNPTTEALRCSRALALRCSACTEWSTRESWLLVESSRPVWGAALPRPDFFPLALVGFPLPGRLVPARGDCVGSGNGAGAGWGTRGVGPSPPASIPPWRGALVALGSDTSSPSPAAEPSSTDAAPLAGAVCSAPGSCRVLRAAYFSVVPRAMGTGNISVLPTGP